MRLDDYKCMRISFPLVERKGEWSDFLKDVITDAVILTRKSYVTSTVQMTCVLERCSHKWNFAQRNKSFVDCPEITICRDFGMFDFAASADGF